jgi:hypothetical protein
MVLVSPKLILKWTPKCGENRIHALNGMVTFETEPNKGFRATISFTKIKKHV